jgi:hypothetical protein
MPRVQTRHQDAPRRRAYRGTGIKVGEAHSVFRQTINMGRFDQLLPIATQITIPEVICHDEYDVGLFSGAQDGRYQKREEKTRKPHDAKYLVWLRIGSWAAKPTTKKNSLQSFCDKISKASKDLYCRASSSAPKPLFWTRLSNSSCLSRFRSWIRSSIVPLAIIL